MSRFCSGDVERQSAPDAVAGSSPASSKKLAGQIHVACNGPAPTPIFFTYWDQRITFGACGPLARSECFTAGLACRSRCDAAPPARQGHEPCQRAHIHPLIRRFRRSFAVRPAKLNETASEQLAAVIHLLSCPKP